MIPDCKHFTLKLIAFVCRFLKGGNVDKLHVTTLVADHPRLLQGPCNHSDAHTSNAQHLGDVFLGEQ